MATPFSVTPKVQSVVMRGIVKRFPGVVANDHVDFDVHQGEVHALLGENGAGKSTLMKILYGLYQPDEGEIQVNGRPVTFASPLDAIRWGIGMVHQHFMLVETLTVAENVALGLPSSRGFVTDLERVAARLRALGEQYGLPVDPHARVWQLSVGQQQRVEILKVLYRGASLLILDEPTAVLTPQEVEDLFRVIRQMVGRGHSVVFISHKLHEVLSISDRITVLRDGRKVGTVRAAATNKAELARWMVGREVTFRPEKAPVTPGPVRLAVEDVHARSDRGTPALVGVSLAVRGGEIVGLAGVSGNGQRELAEVIAGLRPPTQGRVRLLGRDVTAWPADARADLGLAYIPEERMRDGVILPFSVAENFILRDHFKPPFARRGILQPQAILAHSQALIRAYQIKTPGPETPVQHLSGGNIQKVVLARELARAPQVIVAAQPTRGLDIGATEYVHAQLLQQRAAGAAVLLISEDLDEILALADRIAVIYEGRIMDVLPAAEADPQRLGLLMAGVARATG